MTAAILLAGGQGSRMGGHVPDKILARVANRSVFAWSAKAFAASNMFDCIVIVYRNEAQAEALSKESCCFENLTTIWTQGGKKRPDSVRNGLQALPTETQTVFIHDCARPLIRKATLLSMSKALSQYPAIALARPMTDTLKIADPMSPAGVFITKPLDRKGLWAMETPQAFETNLILEAHAKGLEMDCALTDDVSAVEALGHPVRLMEAGYPNPKITTQGDLPLIESLLAIKQETA